MNKTCARAAPPACRRLNRPKRFVHRDLKPANVLITDDGSAKLCDFGLVKRRAVDEVVAVTLTAGVGTPVYVAPEVRRVCCGVRRQRR